MTAASLPKAIGRYQILDRLAIGGMAELFKATLTAQHGFEKLVVIKKILPHLASDKTFVEMFIDEARLTAQLDHRHIVQVFELGTDADTPYIAMQYIDGIDVLALLRECARAQIRLPPDIAALIARDVLDALDYAHNAVDTSGRALGIVHRDISPGNVLLSWRGDVKLTDFGIARAAERRHKTEAGTLKGKYGYMSPEQVSGGDVDARSDLFSIGILLAEMVMARRLFTSTNDLDILLMVRDARLDRLHKYANEFPVELRVLTVRALQRRPEDRWQSAAQFRDALDEWLRRTTRVGERELAALLGRVINAPTIDFNAPDHETAEESGLSGPATRMGIAQAEAEAARARAEFIAGEGAIPTGVVEGEGSSGTITVDDEMIAADVEVPSGPREVGDLKETPVLRVVYKLAKTKGTGMLSLEGLRPSERLLSEARIKFAGYTAEKLFGGRLHRVGSVSALAERQVAESYVAAAAHDQRRQFSDLCFQTIERTQACLKRNEPALIRVARALYRAAIRGGGTGRIEEAQLAELLRA